MKRQALIFLILFIGITFSAKSQNEPGCACDPAETVLSLAGKNLLYNELSVNILYDNSIVLQDFVSGKFYKIRSGVVKGPLTVNDPEISPYMNPDNVNPLYSMYHDFISKIDDKYLIKFRGNSYGPYYEVSRFYVTKSGDKFMAVVSENESTGLKLEKLNQKMVVATTEKEKQELQAQSLKLIQEELSSGEDPMKYVKIISNIPGIKYDPETSNQVDTETKFDEIVESVYDDNGQATLSTLAGKKIMTVKPDLAMSGQIYVNSSNTRYAVYANGTITFSDGTTLSDLFNPYLTSVNGKVYLAYLYYSPGKIAIMQCKIEF